MTDQTAPGVQLLYLVARDQQKLYAYLVRCFANETNVTIIRDRRFGDRRRRNVPSVEQRRGERRRRPEVDERLRTLGWATITIDRSALADSAISA